MLGEREEHIYGGKNFEEYLVELRRRYSTFVIDHFQSNIEGEIIDALQGAEGSYDGVILNAGGYTHTSVSIADAVAAIKVPVVEVHISCILAREEFRHTSLIAPRTAK